MVLMFFHASSSPECHYIVYALYLKGNFYLSVVYLHAFHIVPNKHIRNMQ